MFDLVAAICSYAVVAVVMFLILWQRTWKDRTWRPSLSVYFGEVAWDAVTWGYTFLRYGFTGLKNQVRQ